MTIRKPSSSSLGNQGSAGFFLLESLLAILIFSIGVLALVGFHAASIKQTADARQRSNATFVANQFESDMWGIATADLGNCAGTYTSGSGTGCGGNWGARLVGLPNGKAVVEVANINQITITVTWQQPGEDEEHRYVYYAELLRN